MPDPCYQSVGELPMVEIPKFSLEDDGVNKENFFLCFPFFFVLDLLIDYFYK